MVSPMVDQGPFLPLNVSVLTAILENAGYAIRLFDTTFYSIPQFEGVKDNFEKIGIFKPVNWDGYGMDDLKTDYRGDLKKCVIDFKPDFIGISIFTSFNEGLALSLLDAVNELTEEEFTGKVIIGGIHSYICREKVMAYPKIEAIVTGECEDHLIEMLEFLSNVTEDDTCDFPNFIYRKNGQWIETGIRGVCDFENIPFLNWDHFDDRNFYRPFDGEILRLGHVEMARGCPYRCTYCINEHFQEEFSNFWRTKSAERMLAEIDYLKRKYKLEAIKFWDDDFLAMNKNKVFAVTAGLKKMGLKFLCHSRPEHMNDETIKAIAQNGCIQIGVGLESGNHAFRKRMLNRSMSNETMIKAFHHCRKYGIIASAYCMIGMPDETREDILSTARLLRDCDPEVIVHAIFCPYEGNSMYQYAKDRGYVDADIDYTQMSKCFLTMPSISKRDVESLYRTFLLYSNLDDTYYEKIRKAETDPAVFRELKALLTEKKAYEKEERLKILSAYNRAQPGQDRTPAVLTR